MRANGLGWAIVIGLSMFGWGCGSDSGGESAPGGGGSAGTAGSGGGGGSGALPSVTGSVGMNDVSILFPMPPPGQLDQLFGPTTQAAHGELLPYSVFEHAPPLDLNHDKALDYAALRVVAARIDPCFPSLAGVASGDCRRQVRFVLQPVNDQPGGASTTDAALHVFYDVPQADFLQLLSDLLEAQKAAAPIADGAALEVHPTLASEGLDGSYAQAIKTALLARVGAARLTRMTFMQLGGQANVWTFGGFDVNAGVASAIQILGSSVTSQEFSNNNIPDPLDFSGSSTPIPGAPEDLSAVFESYSARQLTDDQLWPTYESALRVENPDIHTPESTDCVSCHVAQPVRLWLDRNTNLGSRQSALRYTSSQNLTVSGEVADTSAMVRGFGWLDDRPAISQRVVNETAAIVSYLNADVVD